MNIILDLILVVIITVFITLGVRNGLIKTLVNLLGTVLSFLAAIFLSPPLAGFISNQFVAPALTDAATREISNIIGVTAESPKELPLEGLFSGAHKIFSEYLGRMGVSVDGMEQAYDAAEGVSAGRISAVEYIVKPAADALSTAIALILIFLLVGIIIKVVAVVASAVFQLPVLRSINVAGGLCAGLLQGLVACFVLCLAVKISMPFFDSLRAWGITEEVINSSLLFKFFYNLNLFGWP